ncbi:hypothetical protein HH1059_20610 [Halorhodospira halochloris]|uniref:Uncharacterized protein n=1 Tax=Halorhodospira halochloris TaxID=1052 RepID=A0A120N049_HALHR|nr:hypothetical protein [Halorhodospira halochloris]MBK1651890.1 hypothetical protein [Halorhodospira halochloris]BAU58768.1 hypothetical protein HH1059_20610 [Halorhodospira halochloris]
MSHAEPRTIYINADRVNVRHEDSALRVNRPGKAATYIPIVRIGRAVIRGCGGEELLGACLALARAGVVIHFQDGNGQQSAWLQPSGEPKNQPAQELAALIGEHTALGPYHWWRDAQRRHCWSMVFRHSPKGDFHSGCKRLEKYLRKLSPLHWIDHEIEALSRDLRSWLQAEIHRRGWNSVCRVLAAQGEDLESELYRCLYIPLLWRFVRWRRQQSLEISEYKRLEFVELQLANPIPRQLYRHLHALTEEYYVSWHKMSKNKVQADE